MTTTQRWTLTGASGIALIAALIVLTGSPQVVRVVIGLLMIVAVPGYAMIAAIVPTGHFGPLERALATLGCSLALAVVSAVVLAALPIGMTRASLAVTLAAVTIVAAVVAIVRSGPMATRAVATQPASGT